MLGVPKDQLLQLPGADDDAAGWDAIYNRLGRPEKADGYKLSDVTLPEGLGKDEQLQTGFLGKAHELGLSTKQADGLFQWWNQARAQQYTAAGEAGAAEATKAAGELKQLWGTAHGEKLGLAQEALLHYGKELKLDQGKLVADLEGSKLGNHPALAQLLAHIGSQLKEDGVLTGRGAAAAGALSPAEAQQQIASLQNDKPFMEQYQNKRNPGHADAIARMKRLYEFAYPEPAR